MSPKQEIQMSWLLAIVVTLCRARRVDACAHSALRSLLRLVGHVPCAVLQLITVITVLVERKMLQEGDRFFPYVKERSTDYMFVFVYKVIKLFVRVLIYLYSVISENLDQRLHSHGGLFFQFIQKTYRKTTKIVTFRGYFHYHNTHNLKLLYLLYKLRSKLL